MDKMKQVFTCSIDEGLVREIREARREHAFKSKSQLVEMAVKKFLSQDLFKPTEAEIK